MTPTIVLWKWKSPHEKGAKNWRGYDFRHVNRVIRQYQEHHSTPLKFLCFTDDSANIECETRPLPCEWPGNYRRIWMFSDEAAKTLPDRVFLTDIDVVVNGNLDAFLRRKEDFVVMTDPGHRRGNRGFSFLLTPGTRPQIYTQFDIHRTPQMLAEWFPLVYGRRQVGDDDAWLTCALWQVPEALMYQHRAAASWGAHVPVDVKIIHFPGPSSKPWTPAAKEKYPWLTPKMQEL